MKQPFPEIAPTIEIFPGVQAKLIADFDRYSNGSLYMGYTFMNVGDKFKPIGSMDTDISGRWFVSIGRATYEVPMLALFQAFFDAHTKPVEGGVSQ